MFHCPCPDCTTEKEEVLAPCDVMTVTLHPDALVLLVAGVCVKCFLHFTVEYDLDSRTAILASKERLSKDQIIELKAFLNHKGNDDAKRYN